jgi:hypothetical protein
VTLTYNLYLPRAAPGRSSSQDSIASAELASISAARESAFGAQLSAALSDTTWYPDGLTLSLVLEHFYAVEPIESCLGEYNSDSQDDYSELSKHEQGWNYHRGIPNNMPDSIAPYNLKGVDLQLYRAARAFGLDVHILPVVGLDRHNEYDLGVVPQALCRQASWQ